MRGLVAIVGKEALSEKDRKFLDFADAFEDRFVRQDKNDDRTIDQTLDLAWDLISMLPVESLTKIDRKLIEKYHPSMKK
jgi:V/A-type H+-transporting ATPase subunit B